MTVVWLVVRRLLIGVIIVLVISALVFAGTEILPGDVARAILGQSATPEALANIRARLGLDEPAAIRYLHWLGNLLTGDLGTSLSNDVAVRELISDRIRNTFLIAGVTASVAVPLAITLGLIASSFPNNPVDRTISTVALVGVSMPDFLVAVILVSVFAVQLGWLPAISTLRSDADISQIARALTLPVTALCITNIAHMARMTRTAVLNVLSSPAIEMAILKGVPRSRILLIHALPNALAPIANVIALNMAYFISGVVVIEVMFNIAGLGKLMVDAVANRDIPLVQACAMIFCGAYVLLNLTADVISILANPRLRHPK